jgi:hypothetical protein
MTMMSGWARLVPSQLIVREPEFCYTVAHKTEDRGVLSC